MNASPWRPDTALLGQDSYAKFTTRKKQVVGPALQQRGGGGEDGRWVRRCTALLNGGPVAKKSMTSRPMQKVVAQSACPGGRSVGRDDFSPAIEGGQEPQQLSPEAGERSPNRVEGLVSATTTPTPPRERAGPASDGVAASSGSEDPQGAAVDGDPLDVRTTSRGSEQAVTR